MKKRILSILLMLCMIVSSMHMIASAEENDVAKLIHSDGTEEYFTTVQEAVDVAETGELVILLANVDETISVEGKAVAIVYNEFNEPVYDVQCRTKLAKENASIIGDLEECILATQNSSPDKIEYYEKIKKVATIDNSGEKSIYFHYYLRKSVTLTQNLTLPSYGIGIDISTYESEEDNLVFDMAGHTINQTAGAAGTKTWNNYPVLTVDKTTTLKDSVGGGKFIGASYGVNVINKGTLIFESGTISTRGQLYGTSYTSALRIQGGHATINGGTVTGIQDVNDAGSLLSTIVVYSHGEDKASLTVNGGTIEMAPAANRPYDGIANACIYDYYGDPTYGADVELYGGIYTDEPEEHYPAPGYVRVCMDEENDIWTVYPTYKVEHYVENLDGTYTLRETDLGSGTVQPTSPSTLYAPLGTTVTAAEKDYTAEHYVYNVEASTASDILTKPTVDAEGNPELFALQMYYDLEDVSVTFDAGEHGSIKAGETATGEYKYGATFPAAPEVEADKHYVFDGWYAGDTKVETFPATVSEDVTYTAHWTQVSTDPSEVVPKQAAYKVEHYLEQVDGSYVLEETELPLYGELGAEVEAEEKTYAHYEYDADASTAKGVVTAPALGADGEVEMLTLQMYYNLEEVTVTFDMGGSGATMVGSHKYGEKLQEIPTPEPKEGYVFEGWYVGDTKVEEFPESITEEVTYTARWKKISADDTVGGIEDKEEEQPESKPETTPEQQPETKPETTPEQQPETKPESKPEKQPESIPDKKPAGTIVTGDSQNIVLWFTVMIAAFACIVLSKFGKKNRR